MLLQDDVVLCAGASGNVGGATLSTLVREGAQVAVIARSRESAERAIASYVPAEARGRTYALSADLREARAAHDAVDAVLTRFGRIDALVNLAGDGRTVPLAESTEEDLRENLDGYVVTAYNLAVPVLRIMLGQPYKAGARSRGHIVTVTAGSSLDPAPRRGLFGAAKAGVNALMQAIAREHKPDGIVANALVLGGVATEVSRERRGEEAWSQAASPQEVAEVLTFLASRRSSGINGALVELNAREVD
jgi:NAD(P)-dependent dehydrogenase (short-subunit alcohol dehydrogenase family)